MDSRSPFKANLQSAMATEPGAPQLERKVFAWLLVALLPAFAVYMALLSPIEEHSYDAAVFHVPRAIVFSEARAQGQVFPRWVQPINAGLGGPLFSFYSPLAYFGVDALHFFGLSAPAAWRLLVAMALIVASMGVFCLALELSGDATGALAACAVYVYSFPILREFFERGSPQGFALALYPWVVYALLRFARRPTGLRLAFAAVTWAAVILAHNHSAALLLLVLAVIAVLFVGRRDWKALGATALTLGCGLLLSSFFLMPFIMERGSVRLENALAVDYAQIAENPVPLRELLGIPGPYDTGLDNNSIGEAAGPLQGLIALAGVLAGPVLYIRKRDRRAMTLFAFSLLGLCVLWLQTTSADALWRAVPALAYIQVRSRLLGLSTLSSAIVTALLLSICAGRRRVQLAMVLAAASIAMAVPVLYPRLQYQYASFEKGITADDITDSSLSAGVPGLTAFHVSDPIWRHLPFSEEEAAEVRESLFAGLPAEALVLSQEKGMDWAKATIELPAPADLAVHILYFPGWRGYVDGRAHPLSPIEGPGYILLEGVPAGRHSIELRYEGTVIQHVSTWISVLATVGLLLAAIFWRSRAVSAQSATYAAPSWWFPIAIALLVTGKALVIDEHTTWFRRTSTCAVVHSADSNVKVLFGETIRLCAIDLPKRDFGPGDTVRITLYWQVSDWMTEPADSFVHLLGTAFNPRTGNPLWGQQDKQLPGFHPLTQWTPGKLYRDTYEFRIEPDAPPGEYQLEIGWAAVDGQRFEPELLHEARDLSVSHLQSLLIGGIRLH